MEKRTPQVGQAVVFHDPEGKAHPALITAVWTETLVNLVHVSSDESRTDIYGRQIERPTSISHKSMQPVHGFYWRYEDEEPNPYQKPLET